MRKTTRILALERTLQMWEELAQTGSPDKHLTQAYLQYMKTHKVHPLHDCFLCESFKTRELYSNCNSCPYSQAHGECYKDGMPFDDWNRARLHRHVTNTKRHASTIVSQLKTLLSKEQKSCQS